LPQALTLSMRVGGCVEAEILENIKDKIEKLEERGHGEVVIKIKNGHVWRILDTCDELI